MNALTRIDAVSAFERTYSELRDQTAAMRCERDALATRVRILEAALACIEREADDVLSRPLLAFTGVQRIGAVARQSLDYAEAPPASVRRPLARAIA